MNTFQYPETRKAEQTDEYFGVKIQDPYRWLENDTSAETEDWVTRQNVFTENYLEKIPFRHKIYKRLKKIWDYPKISAPFKSGGYYFFYKNKGLQNQPVLYIMKTLESEPEVILDPNTLSEDGTVALTGLDVSNNGKYLAYSISRSGSDWKEIYIKEISAGKTLDDHLEWVKFSAISWYKDGFFYSRYDKPAKGTKLSAKNKYHRVFYHKAGTSQEADELIYENRERPQHNYIAMATEDEKYLFLYETASTSGNALLFKKIDNSNSDFTYLVNNFENENRIIGNIDSRLFLLTNKDASRYKLVEIDLEDTAFTRKDLIGETENVLESCIMTGDKFACIYMQDASSRLKIHNYDGTLFKELELPVLGTVSNFNGKKDDPIAFYTFTSFTYPTRVYKYDLTKDAPEIYQDTELNFDPTQYETKQVFYKSKDGTKIPMFISYKKGLELNGNNPVLLYGYGGFNISLTPSFKISRLFWLESGGIYVVANLRGGGEYGEKWHQAGTKLNKQNVFDDFISAAEYLVENKYTNPDKIAVMGGSNGGLLVGAVTNQRPDLFKVAIPYVGVMDMLRFHKFTIGWAWVTDYGSSEDSVQFHNLLSYSPLHNIKEGAEYPAVMVVTADHDDRVVPAHSFKYIATLQEKYKGPNPAIIRIETKAGHGAGKSTTKLIEEYTDVYSFIFYNMGLKF